MKFSFLLYITLFLSPSISDATTTNDHNKIVVTLPPLAGFVLWLKPDADVQCLLPKSADPHHFQLTPRQVATLQQATLFIRSPRDDKYWPLAQGNTPTLRLWDDKTLDTDEHEFNHAWLSPNQSLIALQLIYETLLTIYPEQSEQLHERFVLAQQQLTTQRQAWKKHLSALQLDKNGVMMQHPSWDIFFKEFEIPVRGILESEHHGQEQGPSKLTNALKSLENYKQTILIGDANHNNKALLWLQKFHPQPIITLDALGSCTEPWLQLMQRNMNSLQQLTETQEKKTESNIKP